MRSVGNEPLSRHALAYVLAGGRGSRLQELTDKRAKPAVYFGGKSRIIDFALSNALNSGIRRIGVVQHVLDSGVAIAGIAVRIDGRDERLKTERTQVLRAPRDGAAGLYGLWFTGAATLPAEPCSGALTPFDGGIQNVCVGHAAIATPG